MDERIQKGPTVLDRVVAALRGEVRGARRKGDKLDTIARLAERFRVSTNTVRAALTLLQQDGLVELRHGSGTFVRRSPAPLREVALLAEIDLLHPVTSSFFRDLFRHLRTLLLDAGLEVRLYSGLTIPGSPDSAYSEHAGRQLTADLGRLGAVAAFLMLPDEPWVAAVRERGLPIISNVPDLGPSVHADREGMVRQAVAALAAAGCRRAGFMGWGDPLGVASAGHSDTSLQAVFEHSSRDWGLEIRPEWMRATANPSAPGAGWEAFREVWQRSRGRPDGLVITDDQLLPGTLEALQPLPPAHRPRLASHFTEGNPLATPDSLIKLLYSPLDHARAMAGLVREALSGKTAYRQVLVPHRLVRPGETHVPASEERKEKVR